MLHTISIVNLIILKLNFDKLRAAIFCNFHYECASESLYKSYEGGPSYGNYQPAV